MTLGNEERPNGAEVIWKDGSRFVAELPGSHRVEIDEPQPAGEDRGPRPTDLLLAAAASCSGISAMSLFKKMRQPVTGLTVRASGTRQEEWPKAFTSIVLEFRVEVGEGAGEELIAKAVDLAVKRYCPVSATIEMGEGAATVEYRIELVRA